ncbi:bi-domain-containing oxidoreductase [Candidatus Thioglobus sp. NP1]|uniref:bi-domain-containing oxidoreductase n=1 Tax=Candidatus Thioglobus sp. NP1 TaxID=2508687 RepID=UPI000DEDE437|nr:bi-domain-containing oxidoreductase [Candidatus Thioglobus sp. NP1]AXE61708.1 dehydrogenase [Candidatus Thioglobus sp. NP1]
MKQILQNLSNGKTSLVDVPSPRNIKSNVLIATKNSLVSAGTERMLVNFGKSNLLNKAKQQPDKVKEVLNKVVSDGLVATIDAVKSKLDQPLPLGYCNAGVVLESDVSNFEVGDRVVSNGNHAEVVRVPKNLCVKIPDGVDDESAAFTVLGAVGLQGIRLIQPTIGECFVVTGLGLVGLMCVQMLRANGCRVLGVDFDSKKCELARQFGADTVDLSKDEDPVIFARSFSRGRGVDGVLVTAATQSDEVMHQAAEMCRKRGRIVLVGIVGLKLRRDDFFKKELTFQVSASYGPGRYDSFYEEDGNDYPVGFVRWTEQRNFEAVLDMMDSGALDVQPLITHRYNIKNAIKAYTLLDDPSALGIVLNYPPQDKVNLQKSKVRLLSKSSTMPVKVAPCIGFIGAGNYASRILIPAFKETESVLDTLVTSGGISGVHHGNKNSFLTASTSIDDVLNNESINTVAIVTRHDAHATQVVDSLNAGKHVFVEKPLALTLDEIEQIDKAYKENNKSKNVKLMVGFNRRFAPHIIKIKELMSNHQSPKSILMTVNAGPIPAEHWVQDIHVGGGRIVGEGCHFIDLMRHLVGHSIVDFTATMMGNASGVEVREDKASITLTFADGSFGTILYLANGGSAFPKERIEVFCDNAVLQMDNYRVLNGYGWPGFKKMKLFKQDKGQKACVQSFVSSIIDGKEVPIPYEETIESSRVSIEVANALRGE